MSIKTINRHLETQVEGLFFKKKVSLLNITQLPVLCISLHCL